MSPQQYSRLNSSSQTNSLKDLLQSKIDDLERQVLSRVNTLEEGKGGPKNDTEERAKIESALTSLHQRISELEKGKGSGLRATCSWLSRSGPVRSPGCSYLPGEAAGPKKGLCSTVSTVAGFFFKSDLFNLQ